MTSFTGGGDLAIFHWLNDETGVKKLVKWWLMINPVLIAYIFSLSFLSVLI